jgi:hypothetical protein
MQGAEMATSAVIMIMSFAVAAILIFIALAFGGA